MLTPHGVQPGGHLQEAVLPVFPWRFDLGVQEQLKRSCRFKTVLCIIQQLCFFMTMYVSWYSTQPLLQAGKDGIRCVLANKVRSLIPSFSFVLNLDGGTSLGSPFTHWYGRVPVDKRQVFSRCVEFHTASKDLRLYALQSSYLQAQFSYHSDKSIPVTKMLCLHPLIYLGICRDWRHCM